VVDVDGGGDWTRLLPMLLNILTISCPARLFTAAEFVVDSTGGRVVKAVESRDLRKLSKLGVAVAGVVMVAVFSEDVDLVLETGSEQRFRSSFPRPLTPA
jgi:hypothetical protein